MSDRLADIVAERRRPGGRSTVTIACPWCGIDVECRVWSLAGSGKRCDCGAVFHRRGAGVCWAEVTDA